MADDEIDVEGEFDLKTELGEDFYDANELPSKSANLLPEFTSPAWMLEQGWSLDSCMDEKSKATIEKMLLEEQQYLYGRKTSRYLSIKKNVLLVTAGTSKTITPNKSPWTQEEKNTFLRGMGIFGRSWSKIASLIPTRTSLQVKNYAQQYMKNLAKRKAELEKNELETLKCMSETPLYTPLSTPASLAATVATITTAQPTVSVASVSGTKSRVPSGNSVLNSKNYASSPSMSPSTSVSSIKKRKPAKDPKTEQRKLNSSLKKSEGGVRKSKLKKDLKNRIKSKMKPSSPADGMPHNVVAYADVSGSISANKDIITIVSNRVKHAECEEGEVLSQSSDAGVAITSGGGTAGTCEIDDKKLMDCGDEEIDIEIDIENDDDENVVLQSRSASPSSVYKQLIEAAHLDAADKDNKVESSVDKEVPGTVSVKEEQVAGGKNIAISSPNLTGQDSGVIDESNAQLIGDESSKDGEDDEQDLHIKNEIVVNGLPTASGEMIEFDIPKEEKIFDPITITDEERNVHSDFFDGRVLKTPQRYLKIRNYIIDCWSKCKPNYLNKTGIRTGLKNCGDVNCIGRIHSYLECVGAINFGCEQAAYKNPSKVVPGGTNSRVKGMNKDLMSALPVKTESTRPRKRRIRDETGIWVDEKELEGKTIDHNIEKKKLEAAKKTKGPKIVKPVYDPFKLVPCLPFSKENMPPYEIEMFNTALAIMDIHAHISKTEVIGMLGGQFCGEQHRLTVSMAVPCKSMSTGMQCEMDPVSQTLASEQIEDVGMQVVGWYHSHPTFSPDPSVRDIETQQKFQYWFSKGGNHFVGVIISPYNTMNSSVNSDIRCLTISELHSKEYLCNIPFKFAYRIVYRDNLREILGPASDLAEKYSNYVNRVMLSCQYKASLGITCLSKMLQSVKNLLVPATVGEGENSEICHKGASEAVKLRAVSCKPSKTISGLTCKEQAETLPVCTQQLTDVAYNAQTSPGLAVLTESQSAILSSHQTTSLLSSNSHTMPVSSSLLSVPVSKSKVEEVLHWLEQIFLEKFTPATPRSPPIGSLSSLNRAKPKSPPPSNNCS